MNEEVNFCSQCGAKISSGVKFCSNCGHNLTNSSTKTTSTTPDKTIKVEVTKTNATIEKGFETLGKGVKATPSIIKRVLPVLKLLLIVVAVIYFIVVVIAMLYETGIFDSFIDLYLERTPF